MHYQADSCIYFSMVQSQWEEGIIGTPEQSTIICSSLFTSLVADCIIPNGYTYIYSVPQISLWCYSNTTRSRDAVHILSSWTCCIFVIASNRSWWSNFLIYMAIVYQVQWLLPGSLPLSLCLSEPGQHVVRKARPYVDIMLKSSRQQFQLSPPLIAGIHHQTC